MAGITSKKDSLLMVGAGLVLYSLLFVLTGCEDEEYVDHRFLMDTEVEIRVEDSMSHSKAEEIVEEAFDKMEELERQFDRGTEGSDVWKINQKAGEEAVQVKPETFYLIEKGLEFGEKTGGAFDITIAPLVDLWGFYDGDRESSGEQEESGDALPSPGEIEEVLQLVDYSRVELDEENKKVYLPKPEMKIDLGGIAKGYIVDEAANLLEDYGIEHAMVRGGGDIRLVGDKKGEPWVVGIRDPEAGGHLALLYLSDAGIDTSGDYERYIEVEGERYHHILDPETGYPAEELVSVTAVAPDTLRADVISTVIFVTGPEKGEELLEDFPEVEGFWYDDGGNIEYTPGLEDKLELQ